MNEDKKYIRKLIEFLLGEHLAELLERIEGCDAVENCEFKFAKNFRGYVKKKFFFFGKIDFKTKKPEIRSHFKWYENFKMLLIMSFVNVISQIIVMRSSKILKQLKKF